MENTAEEGTLPVEKLKKTASEQSILRNIEALEAERSEAKEEAREKELDEQISLLKEQLASVQGPAYSELEKENKELKEKLKGLEDECARLGKRCKELSGKIAMPLDAAITSPSPLSMRISSKPYGSWVSF